MSGRLRCGAEHQPAAAWVRPGCCGWGTAGEAWIALQGRTPATLPAAPVSGVGLRGGLGRRGAGRAAASAQRFIQRHGSLGARLVVLLRVGGSSGLSLQLFPAEVRPPGMCAGRAHRDTPLGPIPTAVSASSRSFWALALRKPWYLAGQGRRCDQARRGATPVLSPTSERGGLRARRGLPRLPFQRQRAGARYCPALLYVPLFLGCHHSAVRPQHVGSGPQYSSRRACQALSTYGRERGGRGAHHLRCPLGSRPPLHALAPLANRMFALAEGGCTHDREASALAGINPRSKPRPVPASPGACAELVRSPPGVRSPVLRVLRPGPWHWGSRTC